MGTIISDRLLKGLQIIKSFRTAARVAQQCGGVKQRHGHDPVFHSPLSVLLRDLEVIPNIRGCGDAAETDDDLRTDQRNLLGEPQAAGLLLNVQGVAVFRRAALYHVGDIDFAAIQVDQLQHIVQQLAGTAHKGFALQILLLARALTDEHDLGLRIADAEHHVGARFTQSAAAAAQTFLLQFIQIHTITSGNLFAAAIVTRKQKFSKG